MSLALFILMGVSQAVLDYDVYKHVLPVPHFDVEIRLYELNLLF